MNVLDKVLLLLAGSVDGRGGTGNLLGARGGVTDTSKKRGKDTEGELYCASYQSCCPWLVVMVIAAEQLQSESFA